MLHPARCPNSSAACTETPRSLCVDVIAAAAAVVVVMVGRLVQSLLSCHLIEGVGNGGGDSGEWVRVSARVCSSRGGNRKCQSSVRKAHPRLVAGRR